MRPIANTGDDAANIISIETLKKATKPEAPVSSVASDIFSGLERLASNPMYQPLFNAAAQLLQAKAAEIANGMQKNDGNHENVTVLYE